MTPFKAYLPEQSRGGRVGGRPAPIFPQSSRLRPNRPSPIDDFTPEKFRL